MQKCGSLDIRCKPIPADPVFVPQGIPIRLQLLPIGGKIIGLYIGPYILQLIVCTGHTSGQRAALRERNVRLPAAVCIRQIRFPQADIRDLPLRRNTPEFQVLQKQVHRFAQRLLRPCRDNNLVSDEENAVILCSPQAGFCLCRFGARRVSDQNFIRVCGIRSDFDPVGLQVGNGTCQRLQPVSQIPRQLNGVIHTILIPLVRRIIQSVRKDDRIPETGSVGQRNHVQLLADILQSVRQGQRGGTGDIRLGKIANALRRQRITGTDNHDMISVMRQRIPIPLQCIPRAFGRRTGGLPDQNLMRPLRIGIGFQCNGFTRCRLPSALEAVNLRRQRRACLLGTD